MLAAGGSLERPRRGLDFICKDCKVGMRQSACSLSSPGSILWGPCPISWGSERLCSLPEHTQSTCCGRSRSSGLGVRVGAQDLWHLLSGASC